MFDVGHGGGSFDFTVAEVAILAAAGRIRSLPTFTSSPAIRRACPICQRDEQVYPPRIYGGAGGGDGDHAPAKIINRTPKIGTLQIGAPGDVAIMELVEGQVSFVDTRNNKREGKLWLKPVQTVINGVPFGRPYQAPFAVR